jgi:hypothetical protein
VCPSSFSIGTVALDSIRTSTKELTVVELQGPKVGPLLCISAGKFSPLNFSTDFHPAAINIGTSSSSDTLLPHVGRFLPGDANAQCRIEQKTGGKTSPLYISDQTNINNNTIISVMANGGPFRLPATPPKVRKKEGVGGHLVDIT